MYVRTEATLLTTKWIPLNRRAMKLVVFYACWYRGYVIRRLGELFVTVNVAGGGHSRGTWEERWYVLIKIFLLV